MIPSGLGGVQVLEGHHYPGIRGKQGFAVDLIKLC